MAEVINAWRKTTKAWGCLIQFKAKHGSLFGSTYRDSHLLQLEGRARNITLSGMELRRVSSQWRQVCSAKTSETWNGNIWVNALENLKPPDSTEPSRPAEMPFPPCWGLNYHLAWKWCGSLCFVRQETSPSRPPDEELESSHNNIQRRKNCKNLPICTDRSQRVNMEMDPEDKDQGGRKRSLIRENLLTWSTLLWYRTSLPGKSPRRSARLALWSLRITMAREFKKPNPPQWW